MPSAHQNTANDTQQRRHGKVANTHSLPVQKLDASDASHVTTPRISSGRPRRPSGFMLDHLSNSCGCLSKYAAVILGRSMSTPAQPDHIPLTACRCVQARVCSPGCSSSQVHTQGSAPSAAPQTWTCCTTPTRGPVPISVSSNPFTLSAHPVCDASRHRRDQDNASPPPESCHLSTRCLSREQHSRRVHLHHLHRQRSVLPYPIRPRPLTSLNCSAGYSRHSMCAFKIPAAATQKSKRCSLFPISSAFFHSSS